jgi:hypothetical protein
VTATTTEAEAVLSDGIAFGAYMRCAQALLAGDTPELERTLRQAHDLRGSQPATIQTYAMWSRVEVVARAALGQLQHPGLTESTWSTLLLIHLTDLSSAQLSVLSSHVAQTEHDPYDEVESGDPQQQVHAHIRDHYRLLRADIELATVHGILHRAAANVATLPPRTTEVQQQTALLQAHVAELLAENTAALQLLQA